MEKKTTPTFDAGGAEVMARRPGIKHTHRIELSPAAIFQRALAVS